MLNELCLNKDRIKQKYIIKYLLKQIIICLNLDINSLLLSFEYYRCRLALRNLGFFDYHIVF